VFSRTITERTGHAAATEIRHRVRAGGIWHRDRVEPLRQFTEGLSPLRYRRIVVCADTGPRTHARRQVIRCFQQPPPERCPLLAQRRKPDSAGVVKERPKSKALTASRKHDERCCVISGPMPSPYITTTSDHRLQSACGFASTRRPGAAIRKPTSVCVVTKLTPLRMKAVAWSRIALRERCPAYFSVPLRHNERRWQAR